MDLNLVGVNYSYFFKIIRIAKIKKTIDIEFAFDLNLDLLKLLDCDFDFYSNLDWLNCSFKEFYCLNFF